MAVDPRTPCVIGVAQRTLRAHERPAPEPLTLWEEVCRAAAADAGARGDVLSAVESISVVHCMSWPYDAPPQRLADRLGIVPKSHRYSGLSGTSGQHMVQAAASAMLSGDLDVAIVCGAEVLRTVRDLAASGEQPRWSFRDPEEKPLTELVHPPHPSEQGVVRALTADGGPSFALWDNARRGHLGIGLDEYRRQIGEMLAPMTGVAATNPHAWFPQPKDSAFLITPRPDNRMVAYPYAKHMMAIMDVDMAAAVIVASHEAADRLGVPADQRVYLRGWCFARDPLYAAEHPYMWSSPAMAAASREALDCAGVQIDEVEHLDLYSCFPSSLNFARDALGISRRPGNELTVTGGLPYAGGPGSNYVTHAIAALAGVLRSDPGSFGMVSGVGLLMTNHLFGVYSTTPPVGGLREPDEALAQDAVDQHGKKVISLSHEGPAVVAAYSLRHDRSGEVVSAVAVCDLPDGTRAYALVEEPDALGEFEQRECVGEKVTLRADKSRVNVLLM